MPPLPPLPENNQRVWDYLRESAGKKLIEQGLGNSPYAKVVVEGTAAYLDAQKPSREQYVSDMDNFRENGGKGLPPIYWPASFVPQ